MDLKDVKTVKELLLENKLTQQQIGDRFDVSRGTISNIARNKQYADIEPRLQAVKIPGGQQKHLNLEEQNLALMGTIENLRQERNLRNRQLRAATARVSIVDDIVEQLAPIIKPLKPAKPFRIENGPPKVIDETLVLMFSDNHCDQVVTPEETDGLEDHDFLVSARRHEVMVEELIKWSQRALVTFRFKKLVIFGLGDYTSGEIHGHANKSYYGEQFTNDLAIAQLFSQVFRELASHFEEVEIVTVIGNHGRLTKNIEYTKEAVPANHDTLIMKIAEVHCKDIPNIDFEFPRGLSTIKEINGYNFFLHHGHGKAGSGKVWAQAEKKANTIVPLHRGGVNYLCSGHFHSQGEASANGGARFLGNGAFLACDPFAYQKLEVASDPCQYIFGVHRNNGVSWRLPIQLRTDGEKKGPQRYQILEKP